MSFIILTLLLAVIQLFGQIDNVFGFEIDISEAPWQASVLVHDKHRCGGVIYKDNVILTIAQCVKGVRTGNLAVRVGSDQMDLGGQVVPVTKVVMQLMGSRPSDVAILTLKDSVELNDNVKPIELASRTPRTGTKASVTGWANVVGEEPAEEILMKTNLTIVEKRDCRGNDYLIKRILSLDELCASKSNSSNLICQGFSGGPLVSDGKLIGIGSWNSKCDFLRSPLYMLIFP
ncbi:trypsin-1-like [Drosophila serrata]|uniref:trypsin-1-like n=1 Tax=Drosophila serrata TaxID=7274 RepID=UPI000A1D14C2|nr:trypsin-1-like [Drosophila serrata]